jgi:tetratricopeptide (TPR) repeat protein
VHLLSETLPDVSLAIEALEKARVLDPTSALPLAGLAYAYARMAFTFEPEGDWYERAVATCDQALAIDPKLPEGRMTRGRLLFTPQRGFDHAGALREFAAAAADQPSLHEAHGFAGAVLFHISLLDESADAFLRALAINPDDPFSRMHLGMAELERGNFSQALAITEQSVRAAPQHTWGHYQLASAQLRAGERSAAVQTVDVAGRKFPREVLFDPIRAILAAQDGDRAEALGQIGRTVANRLAFGHYHHAQYDVACALAQLGDRQAALDWLTEASGNGYPCHAFFEIDPLMAPLRSERRFVDLMARLRIECDGYRALWRDLRQSSAGH